MVFSTPSCMTSLQFIIEDNLKQLREMSRLLIVVIVCVLAAVCCGTPDQHEWNPDNWLEQSENPKIVDQCCTELQVELGMSQNEVRELHNKIKELEQRFVDLEKNITNAISTATFCDAIPYLESKITKYESVIREQESKKSDLEKLLSETMKQLAVQIAEKSNLMTKVTDLEADKIKLLSKLANHGAENDSLPTEQVQYKTEKADLSPEKLNEAQLIVQSFAEHHNLTRDIMGLACNKGHESVVRARLDLGRSTEVTFSSTDCLHHATCNNHLSLVRLLLDRGANINARDSNDWTPLIWAARNGRLEIAKLLVERGADKTLRDKNNMTALRMARTYSRPETIPYLVSQNVPE